MFFRFLLTVGIGYLFYKLIRNLLQKGSENQIVKGKQKSNPIDLNEMDIQDADYEDLDE